MYRKVLATLLLFVPAFASANFPDVFGSNPSWDAIRYVQDEGIVEGYPNGQYKPDYPINRAEFVKILIKTKHTEDEILNCADTPFKDVVSDDWFAKYVCVAQKDGVIDGYPDGTFQAANDVSFAEAAKILRNTMLTEEALVNSTTFTEWYEPYVNALSAHRAIPVSINGFDHMITRQEMAEMIYRLDADLTFMPSLSIWEIGDRAIIDAYYNAISYGRYEDAYALKAEPEMTLEEFKTIYEGFPHIYIDAFSKTAAHTYEFTAMTYPNISGSVTEKTASERYKISMEVRDGKLKTLSSEKLTFELLEEITNGNENASVEWEDGVYLVTLFQDSQEIEAKRYDTKNSLTLKIKNLAFSPDGKYLTWQFTEWEMMGAIVYDIAQKKVSEPFYGASFYGFTQDGAHFYACSESGMISGSVEAMDLPGLLNRRSLLSEDMLITGCGPYDAEKNILSYTIGTTWEEGKGTPMDYQF